VSCYAPELSFNVWNEEMRGMAYALAVDGGNTKTIAAVAAMDGAIVGVGYSGCSDIYNATPAENEPDSAAAALANAMRAVTQALDNAGATRADLAATVFNMAGADWPEDIAFWREAGEDRSLGRMIIAQNDALGILYATSPEAVGVSIVAGTGAATGARAMDGRVWHSSFWQDEAQGAGYLGEKLLYAVYRSELGLIPSTSLTARALDFLGVRSVEEALHLFHNRLKPATIRLDRLAPLLLDEAHAGDEIALRIVEDYAVTLSEFASVAARMVGLGEAPFPVTLAGGLFRHPTNALEIAVRRRLSATTPAGWLVRSQVEPVAGVVVEALGVAGAKVDQALIGRISSAFPLKTQSSASM
jgi:N-acetylglucosamine kinase-like BadF-type ATPase